MPGERRPGTGSARKRGGTPSVKRRMPGHPAAQRAHTTAAQGQLAGSPTESEQVRELTGMALGRSPSQIPRWGSLLTAPLFRGATVSLRTRA